VVLDETHEAHVLDALALARQRREEHGLEYASRSAAVEMDGAIVIGSRDDDT
jgi:hypothetical protein